MARPGLPSEAYVTKALPHIVGSVDLTALLLLNVYWLTNVTPMAAGGTASLLYWLLTGLGFFIPCSIVLAQLATWFPVAGGIYAWTYYALGPRWSFFVSITAWLPGILSMINAVAAVVSCLQALNGSWLVQPGPQGVVIMVILAVTGVLACQRTRLVLHILTVAAGLMLLATLLIVSAAGYWLISGHPSMTNFADLTSWQLHLSGPHANLALLGSATLALLGSDMPLCLGGELTHARAIGRHLWWGTVLTLGGYLLVTAALLIVQGPTVAAQTFNPMLLLIATVDVVFGKLVGDGVAVCLLLYFVLIPVALQLCFVRLPLSAAIDQRISIHFGRLNKDRIPTNALLMQTGVALFFTIILYLLIPLFTVLGSSADLTSIAYNVLGAGLLLVWAISFLFLFLDAAILGLRSRRRWPERRMVVPLPLLLACVVLGMLICGATIVSTLLNSFIPQLVPNERWWMAIGLVAVISLTICAIFSMLTSSEAQWEGMQHAEE
jgi:glutamate:GABA antiporter